MLMPVFHGKSSEYPKGTILDQEDIEYIVCEKLTDEQITTAASILFDITEEDVKKVSTIKLREQISRTIASDIYHGRRGRLRILIIDGTLMDAEYFGIRFEEVKSWE